jgi:hypothetical protein
MSSMLVKLVPLPIFRVGNSQKSLGARSREYDSWVRTGMLFLARNHNHGGPQIEYDYQTPEDSKRNLLPVLPMEQVYLGTRVLL